MNGRYLYQVGDKVVHSSYPDVFGIITQQVSCTEHGDSCETLTPDNPHYHIRWEEEGQVLIGFEHEGNLLSYTTNMTAVKMVNYMYEHEYELWNRVWKQIKK